MCPHLILSSHFYKTVSWWRRGWNTNIKTALQKEDTQPYFQQLGVKNISYPKLQLTIFFHLTEGEKKKLLRFISFLICALAILF